jgi:putative transposase
MGLAPIYQRPKTSEPHRQHRIWPYLLRYLTIDRCFLYLVAIMDWFSRKVLTSRLSNTMVADFCVAGLEEAIAASVSPRSSTAIKACNSPALPSPTP